MKGQYHLISRFSLDILHLDWLIIKLRPIRKQTILQSGLNSDSIKSQILIDTRTFVSLIQFLNYAQDLDFKINYLGSTGYRKVVFKLTDFLEFIGVKKNHYQVQKLGNLLRFLQTLPPMLIVFLEDCFKSTNIFPYIKVVKKKIVVRPISYC